MAATNCGRVNSVHCWLNITAWLNSKSSQRVALFNMSSGRFPVGPRDCVIMTSQLPLYPAEKTGRLVMVASDLWATQIWQRICMCPWNEIGSSATRKNLRASVHQADEDDLLSGRSCMHIIPEPAVEGTRLGLTLV